MLRKHKVPCRVVGMVGAMVLTLTLLAVPQRAALAGRNHTQPSLTILFFTASWCEPCRAIGPILQKFAETNPQRVKLVAVDFDRAKPEAVRWGVQEIPVVIVLSQEGKVVLRTDGASPPTVNALKPALEKLLKSSSERR